MRIQLASVTQRRGTSGSGPASAFAAEYVQRAARLAPTELVFYTSESDLLNATPRTPSRPAACLALFDPRGEAWTSEQFARWLGRLRDDGTQRLLFGIGPADGWSAAALTQANQRISLGPMTLPHELARVVAAEQIYRALTILAGHPYHTGH